MGKKYSILLVEDDASLGYLLTEYLRMKDFDIIWEKEPAKVIDLIQNNRFDLAILDVMMVRVDGFTLAANISKEYPSLPFIFLTARSLKVDVLKGFSLGALDYLKKPIDEEELVVRILSLLDRLKRSSGHIDENSIFNIGMYRLNSSTQELFFESKVVHLTSRESELLKYLASHPNELCEHKGILETLWGNNDYFNRKSLNVFVTHLRKYLAQDPTIKIENVHGRGFILKTNLGEK
ncbi:response regulator transcription factor [Maribacter sp. TH_r10]|uniref:Response regulator n=1 Tax=Maribacter luteus TaxID=2594478 RepID=A0A6I2MS42_9FLAO|nr:MULTISPECIES: response regulator transcription factor [Maribacter]MDV7140943.1 response regulator transcription factor [Maribacter sp. TH_r10]MRX65220.1 response regulator [Maribacter luteus]